MVYKRVVEIGRVVFVSKGKDSGKLAAIVDVLDGNRALVDGPPGMERGVRNFKDLHLTKFAVKLRHGQRTGAVRRAWSEAKVDEQWPKTQWAQKIAKRAIRAKLTDFDRFKLMKAKQQRNRIIRVEMAKLRKTNKSKPAIKKGKK